MSGGRGDDSGANGAGRKPAALVFAAFLMLGLTSFGGPVAHIGYFREAFVTRRRWIEDRAYADLVALCQMLPGPTSSQVGIGIGLAKAGLPGAAAAWVGFTLPSAVLMVAFGYGVAAYEDAIPAGALQGLKVVAAAVVAQAVWGMARSLCPDAPRATVAVLAAIAAVLAPSVVTHVAIIAAGALAGLLILRPTEGDRSASLGIAVDRRFAILLLALFLALLIAFPILASAWPAEALQLVDGFYRSASLVFGGGHVLLPLLQAEVVPPGWVGNETFIAGYGAAQAVPGPLFTFAAYLGAVAGIGPGGVLGGLLCLGRGLPALVPPGGGRPPLLGAAAALRAGGARDARRQRGRRRPARRGLLRPDLDRRRPHTRRSRARARRLRAARLLEGAALGRGDPGRAGRLGNRCARRLTTRKEAT